VRDIAIAAGDLEAASAAALELGGIAVAYGSTALHADAQARGAVQLAAGAGAETVPQLRRAYGAP
jgi:hypothetical protein